MLPPRAKSSSRASCDGETRRVRSTRVYLVAISMVDAECTHAKRRDCSSARKEEEEEGNVSRPAAGDGRRGKDEWH